MFFGGNPFGSMFGDMQAEDSDDDDLADNEEFYKLLGISSDASEREIKKAFKKAAMKHHPDRGGDEETFKKVEKAKDVLLDPEKRRLYDRFGEKGLEGGRGGMGGFSSMFGGHGGRRGPQGPPMAKPISQVIDITLEDVFKGCGMTKTWKSETADRKLHCSECRGSGKTNVLIRQGGMVLQTSRICSTCGGQGTRYVNKRLQTKTGMVHVPQGIKSGGKITLEGEGNSLPGYRAGNVVFTVRVSPHPVYKREGADIGATHNLTLAEALCGYSFTLKHLSGKLLQIKSAPGEVVKPGQLKVLKGYGLPQKGAHYSKGHLYIKFDVIFPLSRPVNPEVAEGLQKALVGLKYPKVEKKIELGPGSRIKVELAANAADKIYRQRRPMTVLGVISEKHDASEEAWAVELDPREGFDSKQVVVPMAWVKPYETATTQAASQASKAAESARSDQNNKKRKGKKKKRRKKNNSQGTNAANGGQQGANGEGEKGDQAAMDEDDYEDEEEVSLENVEGERPKPTPASSGAAAQEEEEEERRHQGGGDGGVQCQHM